MSIVTNFNPFLQPAHASVGHDLPNVERIQERLRSSSYLALRKIGCDSARGCFVLWGSLPSYYLKQMAQVLAGDVVGLEKIKNRIQVQVNPTNR